MALIKCPECGKEISDKAASCPNCGCPISSATVERKDSVKDEPSLSETTSTLQKKNKSLKGIIIAIVAIIIIAVVAVFIGIGISKKNAKAKREQQIQDVKTAMDNVDNSLGDLLIELNPETPFLYGDSESESHKTKIKGILDTITDNQKIVEDAYKNEDREFVKELDDYISSNKTYRSWDEYNTEIKKLYGNSITNDQAADNLVKEMASSEEDYYNYKNHYFVMTSLISNGEHGEYDMEFDPESDFGKISKLSRTHKGEYYYRVKSPWIVYEGDESPKTFTATFKLLGTNGRVIAEQEWDMSAQKKDSDFSVVYGTDGLKRITYVQVASQGMKKGDAFMADLSDFYSETNDTPTALVMEVTSDVE